MCVFHLESGFSYVFIFFPVTCVLVNYLQRCDSGRCVYVRVYVCVSDMSVHFDPFTRQQNL